MGDKSIGDLVSELFCNWVLCCCTASFCLTNFMVLAKVNSGSIYRRFDSNVSQIPTTNRSRSISSLKLPYSHESISWYNTAIYSSADSSGSWLHLLNRARSKITFLRTLKYSSNLPTTELYFALSVVEIFVDDSTSSASSPIQYKSVLTCRASPSLDARPKVRQYCSNLLLHLDHPSGFLKLNRQEGSQAEDLKLGCHT